MPENPARRMLTAAELPADAIPVYRPRLPSADALRPYLEVLDHTRWYSNHGPLERQLATRLSRLFGSSGTGHWNGQFRDRGADWRHPCPRRPGIGGTAIMPLPRLHLCRHCGGNRAMRLSVLHLVDVDAASWSLDPATADGASRALAGRFGCARGAVWARNRAGTVAPVRETDGGSGSHRWRRLH